MNDSDLSSDTIVFKVEQTSKSIWEDIVLHHPELRNPKKIIYMSVETFRKNLHDAFMTGANCGIAEFRKELKINKC